MLGILRLALAASVAAFHAGWRPFGLDIGVSAVVCFYIISGYAMTGLLDAAFADGAGGRLWSFYRDRLLRLLPQYYLWCAVTFAALTWFGLPRGWGQEGPASLVSIVANLTILPLGFWMYVDAIRHDMLIPQAWSLSTELLFYALFPLLLRNKRLLWGAAILGASMFCIATSGRLDPDAWGYRLLPAPLVFFLLGHGLYRGSRALTGFLLGILLLDAAFLQANGVWHLGFNRSLIVGGLLGLPLIAASLRLRPGRFDQGCGAASYGCYLCHWLFLPLLSLKLNHDAAMALIVGGAMLGGWLSYLVTDRPIGRVRRHLRRAEAARMAGGAPLAAA